MIERPRLISAVLPSAPDGHWSAGTPPSGALVRVGSSHARIASSGATSVSGESGPAVSGPEVRNAQRAEIGEDLNSAQRIQAIARTNDEKVANRTTYSESGKGAERDGKPRLRRQLFQRVRLLRELQDDRPSHAVWRIRGQEWRRVRVQGCPRLEWSG